MTVAQSGMEAPADGAARRGRDPLRIFRDPPVAFLLRAITAGATFKMH